VYATTDALKQSREDDEAGLSKRSKMVSNARSGEQKSMHKKYQRCFMCAWFSPSTEQLKEHERKPAQFEQHHRRALYTLSIDAHRQASRTVANIYLHFYMPSCFIRTSLVGWGVVHELLRVENAKCMVCTLTRIDAQRVYYALH
jgi:hypothetical protein